MAMLIELFNEQQSPSYSKGRDEKKKKKKKKPHKTSDKHRKSRSSASTPSHERPAAGKGDCKNSGKTASSSSRGKQHKTRKSWFILPGCLKPKKHHKKNAGDNPLKNPHKSSDKHQKSRSSASTSSHERPAAGNGDCNNSGKIASSSSRGKHHKTWKSWSILPGCLKPKKHHQKNAEDNPLKITQETPTIAEFLRRQPPLPPTSSSSQGRQNHMTLRQATRNRLMKDMLGSSNRSQPNRMKVLIMDEFATKIMSSACKMSELFEEGIALVELLHKKRDPFISLDAVYFMRPTKANVAVFMSDMSGKAPLYSKAFVFFTSPEIEDRAAEIKIDVYALSRIAAMSVVNVEYLATDAHFYLTGHKKATEELLFAKPSEGSGQCNASIKAMAASIATVFGSLNEFPCVRYRAARSTSEPSVAASVQDLAPTLLAAAVWNCLEEYKAELPTFPEKETCELLIVDRAIDLVAPVIHDWSYEAMCFDLLPTNGKRYTPPESQNEVILDDHDSLWVELRHAHAIEASERLCEKGNKIFKTVKSATQARLRHSPSTGGVFPETTPKMFRTLLQCAQMKEKLSLHVQIAGQINEVIKRQKLQKIGSLEEDLVSGRAKRKDLVRFLKENHDVITVDNKLRLVMVYASLHPEEIIESEGMQKLMQIANLSPIDQIVVKNTISLAGWDARRNSETSSRNNLLGKLKKKYNKLRREHEGSLPQHSHPVLEDMIVKLNGGVLSEQEYPYINAPSRTFHAVSRRTRYSSSTTTGCVDHDRATGIAGRVEPVKMKGKRIFIFVIGGATRSEIHAVDRLSSELKREIILGSTSLDNPLDFVKKMRFLSAHELVKEN